MSMRDTPLWTWHVIAGLIILVLLGLHMGIMHLSGVLHFDAMNPAGDSPLDWANVAYRAKMIFFTLSYIVLLGAGLFHGLCWAWVSSLWEPGRRSPPGPWPSRPRPCRGGGAWRTKEPPT